MIVRQKLAEGVQCRLQVRRQATNEAEKLRLMDIFLKIFKALADNRSLCR